MRATCARVLAAALMTGSIAAVVWMSAVAQGPGDAGRPVTAPPSSLERTVRLAAQPAARQKPDARFVPIHANAPVVAAAHVLARSIVVARPHRAKRPAAARQLAASAGMPELLTPIPHPFGRDKPDQ